MRNKLKENDRLHEMKVENLNRKVSSLLKEVAALKKTYKRNGTSNRDKREPEKIFPKEDITNSNPITTNISTTERNEGDNEHTVEKSKKMNRRISDTVTKRDTTRNSGGNKSIKDTKTKENSKQKDNNVYNRSLLSIVVNEQDNNSAIKDSDCSQTGTHTSSSRSTYSRSGSHSRSTSRSKSLSLSCSESNSRSQTQTPTNITERNNDQNCLAHTTKQSFDKH